MRQQLNCVIFERKYASCHNHIHNYIFTALGAIKIVLAHLVLQQFYCPTISCTYIQPKLTNSYQISEPRILTHLQFIPNFHLFVQSIQVVKINIIYRALISMWDFNLNILRLSQYNLKFTKFELVANAKISNLKWLIHKTNNLHTGISIIHFTCYSC